MARKPRYIRRSKKNFATAQEAFANIQSTTNLTTRSVKVAHTGTWWRWLITRTYP